eukprot:scaffold143329_cov66-Phaeocystis_antarctica.AAC.3
MLPGPLAVVVKSTGLYELGDAPREDGYWQIVPEERRAHNHTAFGALVAPMGSANVIELLGQKAVSVAGLVQ